LVFRGTFVRGTLVRGTFVRGKNVEPKNYNTASRHVLFKGKKIFKVLCKNALAYNNASVVVLNAVAVS
jgi:hypothetical protein